MLVLFRLTEQDTEYEIHCVKHVFDEHLVFQFNCTNTIKEQVLEAITVVMDMEEAVSLMLLLPNGCSL